MKPKCSYCKSENVVKRGLSPTRNRGKQQRYLCKDCKKTFIQNLGFWKMKHNEQIVTMSIDMYLSNLSSRKMRNQLKRHMNTKISHVAIMNWIYKYVLKVQKFVENLQPQLSGKIYADETEVNCEGDNDIFWCAVDWETRFINATLYSPKDQNVKDATEFLRKIDEIERPQFVQTDGLPYYPRAFRKVFVKKRYDPSRRHIPEHRIVNYKKTKKYNVRIESVFMKIKDRVQDFRGFKSIKSAPILMAGLVLQHNFIEAHMGTGKVPCELAGLEMNVGVNRWMNLIKLASF